MDQTKPANSVNRLLTDLENLYQSKENSDFMLVSSDEKEFPVHRAILAIRSKAFAAIFRLHTNEVREGKHTMPDIDGETLEVLMEHIYCGHSSKVDPCAEGVLAAAEKFGLEDLKLAGEKALKGKLNPENVGKMLILADKYSAADLKSGCLECIKRSQIEFVSTGGMQELIQHNPKLVDDVFLFCARHQELEGPVVDLNVALNNTMKRYAFSRVQSRGPPPVPRDPLANSPDQSR